MPNEAKLSLISLGDDLTNKILYINVHLVSQSHKLIYLDTHQLTQATCGLGHVTLFGYHFLYFSYHVS